MFTTMYVVYTGFPLTWKTPGILFQTWIFCYDKMIYAGFDTVTAV